MPLDTQSRKAIERLSEYMTSPMSSLSPSEARNLPSLVRVAYEIAAERSEKADPEPVEKVEDISVPAQGWEIPARLYVPREQERGDKGLPALVYYHGGGWVLYGLEECDYVCRALANRAGCVVLSVDYRKAPEHRFPAATDDAYAAYCWVKENAARIGADRERVAVGGEDSGGNLAAVTALRCRNEQKELPTYQLLVYPITEYAFDTPSYQEHAHAKPLDIDTMRWFWEHYLNEESEGRNPYASPLRAEKHGGLPPALLITADEDPLTSEGQAYIVKLRDHGVPVEHMHYDGAMHGFFAMPGALEKARWAVDYAADCLRSAFEEARRTGIIAGGDDSTEGARIVEGMEVVGADGESVGNVKEVRKKDFLVDRRVLRRDVYVPVNAIRGISDERIVLEVEADWIDEMDWERPPIL